MKFVIQAIGASVLAAALVFGVSGAQAQEITESKTYLQNKSGSAIKSRQSKNCVQRQSWDPENTRMVEGCGGVILAVAAPGAVMFEFDSAELTPAGKAVIDKERKMLKSKMDAGYTGTIVGYTDSSGDPSYNVYLSEQRALSVRNYLFGTGESAKKVGVIGQGAKYPVATNDTREGRRSNRRVEFVFSEDPR